MTSQFPVRMPRETEIACTEIAKVEGTRIGAGGMTDLVGT